jgi:hypothetical protein
VDLRWTDSLELLVRTAYARELDKGAASALPATGPYWGPWAAVAGLGGEVLVSTLDDTPPRWNEQPTQQVAQVDRERAASAHASGGAGRSTSPEEGYLFEVRLRWQRLPTSHALTSAIGSLTRLTALTLCCVPHRDRAQRLRATVRRSS